MIQIEGFAEYVSQVDGYGGYDTIIPNVKIFEGGEPREVQIVWTTEQGTDFNKSFTLAIKYKGWYKGMTTCTGWSAVRTQEIDASACHRNPPHPSSRWYWMHNLDIDGVLSEITSGGKWAYETRKFDTIEFNISIIANHTESYIEQFHEETTGPAFFDGWIGNIPKYTITNVYYESSDLLVIEYNTTWTRIDDRWCIEMLWLYESESRVYNACDQGALWGSVSKLGRIEVPVSSLRYHIKNRRIRLTVRFNATYRLPNWQFAHATYDGICGDLSICNTPYVTLVGEPTEYGVGVIIRVGDLHDLGAPIEKVTVKLRGGKYSFHQKTVNVGDVATFGQCPLNKELYFDVVGSRGKATSAVVSIKVAPIKSEHGWLEHLPSGEMVPLIWRAASDDRGLSVKTQGNYEMVNLARRRPSAMWGDGGTTSVSITRAFLRSEDGLDMIDQLELFAELGGEFVIRDPDGHVYAIAGTVSISNPSKTYWKVTISGDEVDA